MGQKAAHPKEMNNGPARPARPLSGLSSKGEKTRQRILDAARQVFARVPFRAASLRQIAGAAGVRHPLIVHYFGSKAALFEEVAACLEAQILESHPEFFERLDSLTPQERGGFYVNGVVRQAFVESETYRFLLLNVGDTAAPSMAGPGLSRLITLQDRVLTLARAHVLGQAPPREASLVMLAFTLIVSQFVGARRFHERVLDLSAGEYETWARQAVDLVFAPVLARPGRWRPAESVPDFGKPERAGPGPGNGTSPGNENGASRGDRARHRILAAGRQVFSTHAYDAATIRMVGQAGHFDHSLIHHLFPTKEDLFAAVATDAYALFEAEAAAWRIDPAGRSPWDVFSHYLEQGLKYCFANQQTIGLLLLNVANYEAYEDLSGFVHMARVHSRMLDMVGQSLPPGFPAHVRNLNQWLYSIVLAGYTFAGAPEYPARLMGLSPDSPAYRQRVFETLFLVFGPSLARLTRS